MLFVIARTPQQLVIAPTPQSTSVYTQDQEKGCGKKSSADTD